MYLTVACWQHAGKTLCRDQDYTMSPSASSLRGSLTVTQTVETASDPDPRNVAKTLCVARNIINGDSRIPIINDINIISMHAWLPRGRAEGARLPAPRG